MHVAAQESALGRPETQTHITAQTDAVLREGNQTPKDKYHAILEMWPEVVELTETETVIPGAGQRGARLRCL